MSRRDRHKNKKNRERDHARAGAPKGAPGVVRDVGVEELEAILARARAALSDEEYATLKAAIETLTWLTGELEHKTVSLARLRKLLFGITTEKLAKVLAPSGPEARGPSGPPGEEPGEEPTPAPKGHGRNGADAYEGAERVRVSHPTLSSSDPCPECKTGKVYTQAEPHVLVRVRGQAPLAATVYELATFRCNLCGEVFVAPAPEGVGDAKYDATSAAMIGLLKYGSGLPFNRLERLEGNLGIPLPAATQWDIVEEAAEVIEPAYGELIRQAAQGEVLHNDDTTMKILALMGEAPPGDAAGRPAVERTGVFTSGIVSTKEDRKIAVFFTGRRHAGENLEALLAERAQDLGPPIQMCDALSRNLPGELETIVANCLAHGRRRFVDVVDQFPAECRHVLTTLAAVYENDAAARAEGMTPEARRAYHRAKSDPLMQDLKRWFTAQFQEKKVEPNSPLGEAIAYMLKHWEALTRFLDVPGAPLDNNICERALKKAILHRKNALFYKTENGARVGDLFMSLIYTAELAGANPFDYLTELQEHADEVRQDPAPWMPWNYRESRIPANGPGPP